MSRYYSITDGSFVVKSRPSGKQDYVCHLGETLSIGWDNSTKSIIAHGDVTNVARIMQTYEEYAKNAAGDACIGSDFTILYVEATEDSIEALNQAIDTPENSSILIDFVKDYENSCFGLSPGM